MPLVVIFRNKGEQLKMGSKLVQKVDRYSPMPVYQQIVSDMISRISQEEWAIGDKLPSENELSEEYGASRVTIRQALAKLEADGLIDKQRGRGAFLKANPRRVVQELYLPQIGVQRETNVKPGKSSIMEVTQANAQIYHNLQVTHGSPLVYLERPFLCDKKVVGLNRAWFPINMVPNMAEEGLVDNSITKTLQQRYDVHFGSVENYIEAVMLDASTAHQLHTVSPSPGLKITSVYTNKDGCPVEYAVTIWNGQDTQFHVMISSD